MFEPIAIDMCIKIIAGLYSLTGERYDRLPLFFLGFGLQNRRASSSSDSSLFEFRHASSKHLFCARFSFLLHRAVYALRLRWDDTVDEVLSVL